MEFGSAHPSLILSQRKINGNDSINDSTTTISTTTHSPTLNHINHLQQLQQLNLDHHHIQIQNQNQLTSVSVTGGIVGGGGELTGAEISPVNVHYHLKTTTPPSKSSIHYRECLKNHAANIGGNVTDGCGEFMPSGDNETIGALTCAACNCHRNFHLKFVDGETQFRHNAVIVHPLHRPPPPRQTHCHKYNSDHHHLNTINAPPVAIAYGGGGTSGCTESSSEELNNNIFDHSNIGGGEIPIQSQMREIHYSSSSKKRFRTRFTQEQKQRMLEFAEKVGWRIQKQYEGELEKLCDEVGVKRQVLKVWMHNNKNHSTKKQLDREQPT